MFVWHTTILSTAYCAVHVQGMSPATCSLRAEGAAKHMRSMHAS